MTPQPKLMRVRELATELGLSRSRAYALVRAGRIPAIRVGNAIRIPREAFERWMRERADAALAAVTAHD